MRDAQRYQIQELIAAGGMAEVYLGESSGIEGFRKKVAIKRVLPKLSANEEFINMFLDEARLCAYLTHSRCVQVFDIGQGAGSHFIVMEYVDGADLKGVLDHLSRQKRVMPVEVACLIAMQICEGLAYAHQATDHDGNPLHIVHRDISPHNVLITSFGEVKLVDFGLARASSHLSEEDEDIVKGKFGYLAPESTLRQGVDHRVDIFAVGILLFEMLAGRRLFLGETDLETFKQVQAAKVPDLRPLRSDVNDQLMGVIAKSLARDRDQRYQSANELARDLAAVLFSGQRVVTYESIAQVVRSTSMERLQERKNRRAPPSAEAVMGELILDTLHAFSSEEDELEAPPAERPSGHAPLSLRGGAGYEDPSAWGLGDDFGELVDSLMAPRGSASSGAPTAPRVPGPPPLIRRPPSTVTSERPVSISKRPPAAAARDRATRSQVAAVPNAGPWWRRWFD